MKRFTDFTNKPYNRCLLCPHRKKRCDGPRTSAMPFLRWCEFMRDMRDLNGLTNQYIADEADVSVKTIERIMSVKSDQDIMRETARRIEDVVIGSSNQHPCYLAFEESLPHDELNDLKRYKTEIEEYRDVLDGIHESYRAEMQTIREEAQRKIDYLLKQNEQLEKINQYLRNENDQKSKVIDRLLEK